MNFLRRGIYLIIFCLPLYLIRLEIFNIPTTVLELMIYGLFLLWLINKGYKGLLMALKHERLLVWGIVLLIIGVSVATIFSWDLRLSAGILKGWFIDAILFFLMFISIIKKEDIKNVFNVLICSGFMVSIISLVYLIQGNFNYQGRLQGIYNSPNFLAMYLALSLISSAVLFLIARSRLRRVFLIIVFLILTVVLFFTKSFGALLGIVGALALGLIIYLYNRGKKKEVFGIIALVFIIILIIGFVKIKSIEGLKSFDARFVIWKTAIDSFKSYPVTGIGPGTFESYFPPYPKWGVPQPHNIFLAFLIQTGLVGFIGFILILIWFFSSCGRPAVGWRQLVVLCLMAYILIHGLVDTTYWKNDLAMMFWMIIGYAVVIKSD